jgi:excisionase family DNA binding protein
VGDIRNPRLLIDASEVARITSLSRRAVERLTASGEIPSIKLKATRRYSVRDIEEWLAGPARHERNSATESGHSASASTEQNTLPRHGV